MEEPIKVTGLNAECDLYYTYLEEYYHGITDLDYDEWKEEIMDPQDVDWEMLEYELELAEQEDEEFWENFDKHFKEDFEECYKDCRTKEE